MTQEQNPTFDFQLTLEETNIILAALQEIPAKLCNPVSDKIKSQAQAQIEVLTKDAENSAANDAA
jgi:hypothetical protein